MYFWLIVLFDVVVSYVNVFVQGNSMLSGHMLVFLCCSTVTTKSLQLSLLNDIISKLDNQVALRADVVVWMLTLKAMWEEAFRLDQCEFGDIKF